MTVALLALALAISPAHAADACGVKMVRVASDQPWLEGGVRAVIRTDRPTPGVDRFLLDLGDEGCAPGGACAPVFEASHQPARTTGFFAARLPDAPASRRVPVEVALETRSGRTHVVKTTARRGGGANRNLHDVPGLDAGFTQPVIVPGKGGTRLVTRIVGVKAADVVGVRVALPGDRTLSLDQKQLHRVFEGEARVALEGPHRDGEALVVGLDRDGAEVCYSQVAVELDLRDR